jgi:peptide/nickel transport system permease protein
MALKTAEGAAGATIVLLMVLAAVVGPYVTVYDPTTLDFRNKLLPPSGSHFFGTDVVGRDLFTRVIHAAPVSLKAGCIVVLVASVLGTALGLMAGYYGGLTEAVIMRATDMFVGFPALVLAIAVVAALGSGLTNGVAAVTVIWWPGYARLVRGKTLTVKPEMYVEAARAIGSSNARVITRHILPNILGPLMVKMTLDIGYAILYVAALGFLGLGAQPPTPEWGVIIAEARSYTLSFPWYPLFAGLALFVTVVGFNLLGEGLEKAVAVEVNVVR